MSHPVCLAWSVMGSANTLLLSWISGFNLNKHKPQMNATNQCREGDMWKANVELHKPMYAWETMKNRGKFREPKEPWSMPSSQPSPKMSQLFNKCFQDMSYYIYIYMIHQWQCISYIILETYEPHRQLQMDLAWCDFVWLPEMLRMICILHLCL